MKLKTKFACVAGAVALLVAASPARAEPPMWVIKDADTTIYLFGTVHVLTPKIQWNTPSVQAAVKDSKELWLEVTDADNMAVVGPLIQKLGLDFARPLSKKLTPDQLARITQVAGKYGFPAAQLEPMQPWLAAMTLTMVPLQKAGFDPKLGVDAKIREAATKEGDALKSFENVEQQINFFATMKEADQVAMLMQIVEDADQGAAAIERAATAWSSGDLSAMENELILDLKRKAPQVYDLMLSRRNIDWAGQIEGILKGTGTHFIAVGAGHLVGPDSVQAQLKARGIDATRLQ